jgi:hypothetical protein
LEVMGMVEVERGKLRRTFATAPLTRS